MRAGLLLFLLAASNVWAQGADVKDSFNCDDTTMEIVLQHKDALRKCAEQQTKEDPTTHGKLIMRWRVRTSGETYDIRASSPEYAKTSFARCVREVITRFRFPASKREGDPITFPFKF